MGFRDGRALSCGAGWQPAGRLAIGLLLLSSPSRRGCRFTRAFLWQSECDEGVAGGTLPAPASHRYRHVLLSVDAVRTRRRIRAGFELSLPEHFAGSGIECAELMVLRGADEYQTAGRGDGAAKVGGPGGRNSTSGKL